MYKQFQSILNENDTEEKQQFGNYIAKLVHDCFDNDLPNKKGKPKIGNEWTVLSGIVQEIDKNKNHTLDNKVSHLIFLGTFSWSVMRNILITL